MKKHLAIGIGLAMACLAQSAVAADLPVRPQVTAPAYVPAPATWTGLFVGAGFGYGLFDVESSSFATGIPLRTNGTTGGKGGFGTVQVGYDYQWSSFVVGVFADYDFSDITGTMADFNSGSNFPLKQSSAWAVGGRIGYVPVPQLLGYFTGGYAKAHFESGTGACGAGGCGVVSTLGNGDFSGYFLGGGTEVLIGFLPGWSIKSEYRMARYNSNNLSIAVSSPVVTGATASLKPNVQTFRTELVYKFNWWR